MRLIVVAIVCGLYGLFCAAVYAVNFSKQPWQDWMVYYTAVLLGGVGAVWLSLEQKAGPIAAGMGMP